MTAWRRCASKPLTDHCRKCGRDGIPDTELSLVSHVSLGPSWFGVCQDCTITDGADPQQAYLLAELRAGTLFNWWHNPVRPMPMRRDEDF